MRLLLHSILIVFCLTVLFVPSSFAQLNVPLIIQESIYPGAVTSGIDRTQEPVTIGIPIADNANITSVSQLGLSGANAGQFRVLGNWPNGNIQWVLVDTLADVNAGGQNTNIALTLGSGNFGGANLATDSLHSISINTGPAQFNIVKSRFNLFDSVTVNGKKLVLSSSGPGLVITGPNVYGNTVCDATHLCKTTYTSANDTSSDAILEENGPVKAVIKATGYHRNSSGQPYLAFTVRMYFYKGKSSVKVVSVLRNADLGTSNTFATAFKSFASYEARVSLAEGATPNFSFGDGSSGAIATAQNAILYQAYSNNMETCDWTDSDTPSAAPRPPIGRVKGTAPTGYKCSTYWNYNQSGFEAINGTQVVNSGSYSIYPNGWADETDGTGAGLEVGAYQMSAYWPKSLEFENGGKEARIAIWPDQTLFGTGSQPYISEWPQEKIQTLFFNFHDTPISASNEFLKFQYPLIARAAPAYYNSTKVFFYDIPNAAQEDSYVAQFGVNGTPQDFAPNIWRFFNWENPGGGNQEDQRGIALMRWLQRGFAGNYVTAIHSFQHVMEDAFPHADFAGGWRGQPIQDNNAGGYGYPTVTSANTGLLCDVGVNSCGRLWNKDEHTHFYFAMDYYFLTGDENVKDFIETGGPYDRYLNTNAMKNSGVMSDIRAVGIELMWEARLNRYLTSIGDSSDASLTLPIAETTLDAEIYPDLIGAGEGTAYQGTSSTRGIQFIGGSAQSQYEKKIRLDTTFQSSILLEGMNEYLVQSCPNWPIQSNETCDKIADYIYGISAWGLNEAFVPAMSGGCGTSIGGFSYSIELDKPTPSSDIDNECGWTDWYFFYGASKYTGTDQYSWLEKFTQYYLPGVVSKMPNNSFLTERNSIFEESVFDQIFIPPSYKLVDVPVTIAQNANGTFTLSWIVPAGAASYRIKQSSKNIADWLNFNAISYTYGLDPVSNQPWFSAADVPNVPSPTQPGTVQTITVSGGPHFEVKAYCIK